MGRIKSTGKSVIIEFSLQEVLERTALLKLPDKNLVGFDSIGNFVVRAAWEILGEKAPHLKGKIGDTQVSGAGKVTVKFIYEADNEND